jgi:hypothetical protein
MRIRFSFFPGLACVALLGLLAPSALRADELILNGGFENGVLTSGANTKVPVDWTPNAAFDLNPSNSVTTFDPHSGAYDLSIGNTSGALAALSQTFSDVPGETYYGSFWAYYGGADTDKGGFFALLINGASEKGLNEDDLAWFEYTFSFIGTGSDTLTIQAQAGTIGTDPGEWYVDDVSVSPEPSTLLLLGTGLLGFAGAIRSRLAG